MKKTKPEYINTKKIQGFVTLVENKKGFKRDANLILRHLFEEVAECSAELWKYESTDSTMEVKDRYAENVSRELCDIISLCVYLADVLGLDLNESFPERFKEVARQYQVGFKKEK